MTEWKKGPRRPVGITFIKPNLGERAESVIKGRVAVPASVERAQVKFKSLTAKGYVRYPDSK